MRVSITTWFLISAVTVMSSYAALAVPISQAAPQGIQALVAETQRTSGDPNRVHLVWWVPVDLWPVAMGANPNVSKQQIDQLVRVMSPYTLIAVADGEVGPLGGVNWMSEGALRSRLAIVDSKGEEYTPLSPEQVGADARNLAAVLKPLLTNVVGAVGENLHFFYFPAQTRTGAAIAEAGAEGAFAVKSVDIVHRWRLPLGSLLPPTQCPVDGERMNGGWKFCPWHGKELVTSR